MPELTSDCPGLKLLATFLPDVRGLVVRLREITPARSLRICGVSLKLSSALNDFYSLRAHVCGLANYAKILYTGLGHWNVAFSLT